MWLVPVPVPVLSTVVVCTYAYVVCYFSTGKVCACAYVVFWACGEGLAIGRMLRCVGLCGRVVLGGTVSSGCQGMVGIGHSLETVGSAPEQ